MEIAADANRPTTDITGCIENRASENSDVVRRDGNRATMLACILTGSIQRGRNLHIAAARFLALVCCNISSDGIAAFCSNNDLAIFNSDTLRLQTSLHIDQAIDDLCTRRRRQCNFSSIGLNRSRVGNQLRRHLIAHGNRHQTIAIEIHCRGITRSKMHRSNFCRDRSRVHNIGGNKSCKARLPNCNFSFVDDACIRITRLIKIQLAAAVHKLGIVGIGRGDHKTVHIDCRVLSKQHAITIDHHNIAIRGQHPVDDCRRIAVHPIEGNRRARWLGELYRFPGPNIEAKPIQDGHVAFLNHLQAISGLANVCLACTNGSALWARIRSINRPRKNGQRCPCPDTGQSRSFAQFRQSSSHDNA